MQKPPVAQALPASLQVEQAEESSGLDRRSSLLSRIGAPAVELSDRGAVPIRSEPLIGRRAPDH
jgi:hypothetical protein